MSVLQIDSSKNTQRNNEMIRERMEGHWIDDNPFFSLCDPGDALTEAISRENWRLLLLVRKNEVPKNVLPESGTTPVLLQKVFNHLRNLEAKAKSGRTQT
jgi:hypothetical protein